MTISRVEAFLARRPYYTREHAEHVAARTAQPWCDACSAWHYQSDPHLAVLAAAAEPRCPGMVNEHPDEEDCDRDLCPLCNEPVCQEHDEFERCGEEVVHESCHDEGCRNLDCAEDAREAYLLQQDECDRGR